MDFSLDAAQIATLIAFVAPGFFAQVGYRARYPAPERSAGYVLIISVAFSLPLVAAWNLAIDGSHKPTRLVYALALTAGSFMVGYVFALIRGLDAIKWLLRWVGYDIEPESSIYAQTLRKIGGKERVEVDLKSGLRVRGYPGNGPAAKDDGITELYLTQPEARLANSDGEWAEIGAAAIIPLSEVSLTGRYRILLPAPLHDRGAYRALNTPEDAAAA